MKTIDVKWMYRHCLVLFICLLGTDSIKAQEPFSIPGETSESLSRKVKEHLSGWKDHSTDDQFFGFSKFGVGVQSSSINLGPVGIAANTINGKFVNGKNTEVPLIDVSVVELSLGAGIASGGVVVNTTALFPGGQVDFITIRASLAGNVGDILVAVIKRIPIVSALANSIVVQKIQDLLNNLPIAAGGTIRLDILPITPQNPVFGVRVAVSLDAAQSVSVSKIRPRFATKKAGLAHIDISGRQCQFTIWHIEALTGEAFSNEDRAVFDSRYSPDHPLHPDYDGTTFQELIDETNALLKSDSLRRVKGSGKEGERISIASANPIGPFPDNYILNRDGSIWIRAPFPDESDPNYWASLGISPVDNDGGSVMESATLRSALPNGPSDKFPDTKSVFDFIGLEPYGAEIDSVTGDIDFIYSARAISEPVRGSTPPGFELDRESNRRKEYFLQGLMIPGDKNWVDIFDPDYDDFTPFNSDNAAFPEGGFRNTKLGETFLRTDVGLKRRYAHLIGSHVPLTSEDVSPFPFEDLLEHPNLSQYFYRVLDEEYPDFPNFIGVEIDTSDTTDFEPPTSEDIIVPPTINYVRHMFLRNIKPQLQIDGRVLIRPRIYGKMDANRIIIYNVYLEVEILELIPRLRLDEWYNGVGRASVSEPQLPLDRIRIPVTEVRPDAAFSLENEGQGIIYDSEYAVYMDALEKVDGVLQKQIGKTSVRELLETYANDDFDDAPLDFLNQSIFQAFRNSVANMAIAEWYKRSDLRTGALEDLIDIQPQLIEFGGDKDLEEYLPTKFAISFPNANANKKVASSSVVGSGVSKNGSVNDFRSAASVRSVIFRLGGNLALASGSYNQNIKFTYGIPSVFPDDGLGGIARHSVTGGIVGPSNVLVDVEESPFTALENSYFDNIKEAGFIERPFRKRTHLVAGGSIPYTIAEITPTRIHTEINTPNLVGFNGGYLESRPISVEIEVANNGNRAATNVPIAVYLTNNEGTPIEIETGVIDEIAPYETQRYGFTFDPGSLEEDELAKLITLTFSVNEDRSVPELSYTNNELRRDLELDYIIYDEEPKERIYSSDVDLLIPDQTYFSVHEFTRFEGLNEVPANTRLTTHATQRIILAPGFKAESGSYFKGVISNDEAALAEYNNLFPPDAVTTNGSGLPRTSATAGVQKKPRTFVSKDTKGNRFDRKTKRTKPYILNLRGVEVVKSKDEIMEFNKDSELPKTITLLYPNPTEGKASVAFTLERNAKVSIELYAMAANQKVKTLVPVKEMLSGENSETFDLSNVPAGLYIIMIESNGKVLDSKFVLKE